ncbi:MAG: hypothetical protein IJW70_00370 [Clostridia bacterium]|nr:hypothetical protein [Clostridia bacterium]
MIEKTKQTAGADEKTPSHAQYFSWINNTNEGSTEQQTLINLEYFRWMRDTYGMQLDIYAWDAGNLDGAQGTYEKLDGPKLSRQYPNGYAPVVKAAADIGARMGVWMGPDGYGEDEQSAKERHELLVSLCRDHHFALFKIDGVCGQLREDTRKHFCDAQAECRKYSPDLVLLNHRLELGEGEKYATTFLWQGAETYVDIFSFNQCTAPHNRAFIFTRGETEGLRRLTEDHGVCLSSCMDRFEDDLIYQAFNRNLILAPEIYGNPWLLCDKEQPRLAHIYNLHARLNDILVDGMLLPEEKYGKNAVARGNDKTRVLSFGNPTWEPREFEITLDGEIGLAPCTSVTVISHHPSTYKIGRYKYGATVKIHVEPFRAVLLEICDSYLAPKLLSDQPHRVIGRNRYELVKALPSIKKLGTTAPAAVPVHAEKMIESTLFAMDNDSLESRCAKRAGETRIPAVKTARDAFFAQDTYRLRGCDNAYAFDGNPDTFFDGVSRFLWGTGTRIDGGCLRVDFGQVMYADRIEIEFFCPDIPTEEVPEQTIPEYLDYSTDLLHWSDAGKGSFTVIGEQTTRAVKHNVHSIYESRGKRCVLSFAVGALRYVRVPKPMDRISRISLYKNGVELPLKSPRANNLMPSTQQRPVVGAQKVTVKVDRRDWVPGSYLSVALEGQHGAEGAYAAVEMDGDAFGAPERAPTYLANAWESRVVIMDHHYTYYIPVTEEMLDRELTVWVMLLDKEHTDFVSDVYLCPPLLD